MSNQPQYIIVNGLRKRNPARLSIDVLAFVRAQEEGVTMSRIIFALRAGREAIKATLEELSTEGLIESVEAGGTGNRKGRTDVYWYAAGRLPRRHTHSFGAAATLHAFQLAARARLEVRV